MKSYFCILVLCEGQAELRFMRWLTEKIKAKKNIEQDWRFVFQGGQGNGSLLPYIQASRSKKYNKKVIFYDGGDQRADKIKENAQKQYFTILESQLFVEDFILALSGSDKPFPTSKRLHPPKTEFQKHFGKEAHEIDFDRLFPDFEVVLKHPLLTDFYKIVCDNGLCLEGENA